MQFFDERPKHRLLGLAADFFAQPGELIPQVSHGSAAKTKAAYRFFSNPRVEMPKLLRPHIESTLERVPVILAVQDTTTLNYTAHRPEGAGPINTSENGAVGLLLHDTMAFTPRRDAAGLARGPVLGTRFRAGGKRYCRHQRPIEEKENRKWLISYRAVAEDGWGEGSRHAAGSRASARFASLPDRQDRGTLRFGGAQATHKH